MELEIFCYMYVVGIYHSGTIPGLILCSVSYALLATVQYCMLNELQYC